MIGRSARERCLFPLAAMLALVAASPEGYVEHSSASVLGGRSWTMPTLAGGRLYLRNQEEIVCVDMRSH